MPLVRRVFHDRETCSLLSHTALERYVREALKEAGFAPKRPYHLKRDHGRKRWVYWQTTEDANGQYPTR